MDTCCIYLAGPMSHQSFDEQLKWITQLKDGLLYGGYEYKKKPELFIPPLYYNFEEKHHKSEREVLNFDLNRLRNSDLVVALFNGIESVGTVMEVAIAYENRIPVIVYNTTGGILHPWVQEMSTRECTDMRELVEYIVEYFLN